MSRDRDWIIATLLDVEASDGEVEAAVQAATPGERRAALYQLDLGVAWVDDCIRDLRGAIEHLADQNPGLT